MLPPVTFSHFFSPVGGKEADKSSPSSPPEPGLLTVPSAKAEITLPRADKDLLIFLASSRTAPSAPVLLTCQREQARVRLCWQLQPCKAQPKDAPGGAKPGLAHHGPGELNINILYPSYISFYQFFLSATCNNSIFLPLQEQVVPDFIRGEFCAHLRTFGNHFQGRAVCTHRETQQPQNEHPAFVFCLHGPKISKLTGFVHGHCLFLQAKNDMWWKTPHFHSKTNVLCSTTDKFYFTPNLLVFFISATTQTKQNLDFLKHPNTG